MLDFSIKPTLNKELILSYYSQEQIFCYYLHIDNISKKLIRNPTRHDKNPTCGFYKSSNGTVLMHDFATGEKFNCFSLVAKLYNCDYWQALRIIANDFNVLKDKTIHKNIGKISSNTVKVEEKEIADIRVEIQPFSELELKWWAKYGITPEILKHFDVFSCKHVFLNGNLCAKSQQHCPIFGYYGKKYQGKELWKIYFPKRKHSECRFLGNYPSEKLQGYDKLPKKGKVCCLTKSQKDVMALYAYGIPACAPNSETVIPKETIINCLLSRFEYVFCLWDSDYTGVTFLNKIKRKYPKLHCLIIPRHLGAKDFSDLRKMYGHEQTAEFIKQYLKWLKNRN